jgi:hypothetical protein
MILLLVSRDGHCFARFLLWRGVLFDLVVQECAQSLQIGKACAFTGPCVL